MDPAGLICSALAQSSPSPLVSVWKSLNEQINKFILKTLWYACKVPKKAGKEKEWENQSVNSDARLWKRLLEHEAVWLLSWDWEQQIKKNEAEA